MKHALSFLLLSVALVALPACKSPEHAALIAVTATNVTADSAAAAYMDYRNTHTIDANVDANIIKAARAFQAANALAQDAVLAWKQVPNADNKAKADAAQKAAANAASTLLALVRTFHPELVK